VPELPPKTLQKTGLDNVELRLYSFQKFLEVILSSKELKYVPELVHFLSYEDIAFQKAVKVQTFKSQFFLNLKGRREEPKIHSSSKDCE
jgi:hypothetical protein